MEMRRASQASIPAGGEGGAGVPGGGGGGVSRLQMPQVLTVLTRPPLPAGPSDAATATASVTSPTTTDARAVEGSQHDGDADDGDEPMSPVIQRARPSLPVSPSAPNVIRNEGSVQVAVRVRPLLPKEIATRVRTCVETEDNTIYIPSNDKTFRFDHVFPMEASQKDLYDQVVQPLMDPFLQGYNVTVLAYGQTGSGKTYTMGNDSSAVALVPHLFEQAQPEQTEITSKEMNDHEGVIPRFISEMFVRLQNDQDTTTSQVSVSFLEIYGEEIHDLLDQSRGQAKDTLQVRESNGSVWVQGLTEVKVSSFPEAAEQMRQGCVRRITGSTSMNERSSRSHAVYTVKLVRKTKNPELGSAETESVPTMKRRGSRKFSPANRAHGPIDDDECETIVVSKLTFVDLAGSERLKKTQAEGDRMKEGIQINVGLLALGNVITALGDERRRSNPRQHVAYRDSKLTRLLQDALGGNSRTLFIACVSPAESSAGETVNTLQYANRAKNIQNKAVKNIDPRSAELARSKVLNDVLRNALTKALALVSGGPNNNDAFAGDPAVLEYLRKLEDIAWSIASGSASTAEATMETSKTITALVARRAFLLPGDTCSVTSQGSSFSVPAEVLMDGTASEAGSSVHLDHGFGISNSFTSLRQVCRVLEVVSQTLEMQELKARLTEAETEFEAENSQLDVMLMQKNALIHANEVAVQKMESWTTHMESATNPNVVDRQSSWSQAMQRLEMLKSEAEVIAGKKALAANNFAEVACALRSEMEQKRTMIQQVRQSDVSASVVDVPSPLDMLLQISELKNRFRLHVLCDVAWALEEEERTHCEYLDDHPDVLAFDKKFFPNEDCTQSHCIISEIQANIKNAIAEEDLHASQRARLRERAGILQRIMNGWAGDTRSMSEEEFLAANEQELRTCEETIRELGEALRHQRHSNTSIGFSINSIDSLDIAKRVIKGLVDALYGHKRIELARAMGGTEIASLRSPANNDVQLAKMRKQHEEALFAMRETFTKDLSAAYDMVKPFALESLDQEYESLYAQRQSDAKTIALLEEQAKASNAEIQVMKDKMEELHKQVESMKSQFEQFEEFASIREDCVQLAKELGLPTDTFAGIAAMINPLAIKQAREIRETLLAKKAEKLEEIEVAYGRVKCLESILKCSDPLNIDILRGGHEKALDDQLLAIIFHHSKLAEELTQRIDSQVKVLDSICVLSEEMDVGSMNDLRHAPEYLSAENLLGSMKSLATVGMLKQIRASSDLAIAISEMASHDGSLNDALSDEVLERNGRVLKALLYEKAHRLAEVEKVVNDIRLLIEVMEFHEEDIKFVMQSLEEQKPNAASVNGYAEALQAILRKDGHLDTSRQALGCLIAIREHLVEVRDGRSNALSYVYSVLDEAEQISHDSLSTSGFQELLTPDSSGCNQAEMKEYGYSRDALSIGVEKLKALSDPTDRAIRALLFASNDQFNAYGIETASQRMSFFLGSEDTIDNPNRKLLERYLGDSNANDVVISAGEADTHDQDSCFLSDMDPARPAFATYFSASFGTRRLAELKRAADEIHKVSEIVMSAQARLKSLQKIMTDFNAVMVMKKEIAEFAVNASKKDRLFGSSTVLMKEEKKRKRFAREYPLKLAGLREEVQKWVENEGGDYDLGILGEEMKSLLLDMLNTDTNLMHLDLGVLDTSRPSARRASKTAAGIAVATASLVSGANPHQPGHPNQEAAPAAAPRVRPGSALARDGSSKRRTGPDGV